MAIFTGLFTAIGGLLSSTFLSGGLGMALLKAAVGIGLNLLARALGGNKSQQQNGINGKLQAGGDVARSILLGRTCTAGSLAYANAWGKAGKTNNAYFTQVIALVDHPVSSLKGFWVNGQPVTLSGTAHPDYGYPVTEYNKGGADYLWIKFHDGSQTAADPFLTGQVSSADRPYDSGRVGNGVAYAVVTSRFNQEMFTGFPSFKFELQGRPLYDPSRDSSVGGSGSQRWSNPASWGGDGDDLPAVQIYNILRGIYENGVWLYGLQTVTAARLPALDWIAQINKCRAEVDGVGNGPQYLSGAEVTTDTTIGDAIDRLLTACNGRLIETGGIYKIRVGEPDAKVLSFTDDDILSTEEQSFTPFFGLSETVNGVTGTYPEPAEAWNTKAAPPIYNSTYEAEDGNRRLLTQVQMDAVYRSIQAQRLMKSALAEARRARRHTFVLPPKFWAVEPGDIIEWTSARNGYVTKLFRVDGVADKANLDVTVDLTEVDPSDYDWDPDTDFVPPVFSPVGPIFPPPLEMVGWSVEAVTIKDNDGNDRRPAIRVHYDGDLDGVSDVRVQIRYPSATSARFDGKSPYGDPDTNAASESVDISFAAILPNTDYEVRGRYEMFGGAPADWSAWLGVKTDDIRLGPDDVYLPGMVEEINARTDLVLAPLNVSIRDQIETARQIAASAMNQDAGQYLDRQQLLTQVKSVYENITADYQLLVTAATGPGSAIVQRLETLEVDLGGMASVAALNSIGLVATNVDGTISGVGTAISGIMAQVNASLASGMFRTYVEATETGALATIGISAAASSGGATSQAAILVSALANGKSMIGLVADLVYFTDAAGNKQYPFAFESGVARLNVANIGTITTGLIQAPNGKHKYTVATGTLEWWD